MTAREFTPHDHSKCESQAIAEVAAVCEAQGLKLTTMRRRVLQILLAEHKAMGAYDILERLKADGTTAQPPVAYRALDFLVANGFAHRIEHMNAFVACNCPGQTHDPAFLICNGCRKVAETQPDFVAADVAGFTVTSTVVEARGLCAACQDKDAT